MKEEHYRIVKTILGVIFLILAYLFIQNGRYEITNNYILVDKWNGTLKVMKQESLY